MCSICILCWEIVELVLYHARDKKNKIIVDSYMVGNLENSLFIESKYVLPDNIKHLYCSDFKLFLNLKKSRTISNMYVYIVYIIYLTLL